MDYGKIFRRAWDILWQWPAMLILGLLANMQHAINLLGLLRLESRDWDTSWYGLPFNLFPISSPLPTCLTIFLYAALLVTSIIVQGGLIGGVQQVEQAGRTRFREAWRLGLGHFWTLLGIDVLSVIPFILFFGLSCGCCGILTLGLIARQWQVSTLDDVRLLGYSLLAYAFVVLIVAFVVYLISTYANRAAVLEGLGWTAAFSRGWQVLKDHPGPTLVLALLLLLTGIPIVLMVTVPSVLDSLVLPLLNIGGSAREGLISAGGIILSSAFGLTLGTLFSAYTATVWTLAYRELLGMAQPGPIWEVYSPRYLRREGPTE